ncbi:BTB/POZ domain-containing protein [Apostasia shenzhenica]|uniref:BTB/POZ domain-containing protein n=1 Tax=Apostasia shenzhenica TaxID=1088818 RepID=A0A2I0ARG5_9ASPA|nr:BTB/POZ domain-containing protein [Apostasia shenzhenica]
MFAKKRLRVGSSGRLSSYADSDENLNQGHALSHPTAHHRPAATIPAGFNDPATADVILSLQLERSSDNEEPKLSYDPTPLKSLDLHLHSSFLRRSRYFDALLSDRWLRPEASATEGSSSSAVSRLTLKVLALGNACRPFDNHVTVLQLIYTLDFTGVISSVPDALELLPIALELLFDDCVRACVRFLEAVPWTDEEEEGVLSVIPFLREEESRDLLARVSSRNPAIDHGKSISEEMLHGLILKASNPQPGMAPVKALTGELLRDYPSRDAVRRVLDRAFSSTLGTVRELLAEYASPDFRVVGDDDETEAIHRVKLYRAVSNVRSLSWIVDRMIELRVADTAAREWSEQAALTADLQKTLREDAWRNILPGFPTVVLRCTSKLVNAIAAGRTLAPRQVRMELVRHWLPVLIVCREVGSPIQSSSGCKMLYRELEESFLKIISTLPISDAQVLLQQCICFSTRNVDDCPHLVIAFKTWFRRANRLHY